MRRMEKVTGRSDDMMIVRGVNVFPTQIEDQILKCPGLAPHYLIELMRRDRMDELTVAVEARETSADEASRQAQAQLLGAHIKGSIGVSARIVVSDPGSVTRSQGKAVRVIDNRPKG
jgi:phenylacetate-CoA ligase